MKELESIERYLKEADLEKREKASNWIAAIGLQRVDGLQVSDYLLELAVRNINGEISMEEVSALLDKHYK